MSQRPGRNDPCPCGSSKKYKHCCGLTATPEAAPAEPHDGAVGRALAWLGQYHRKAITTATKEAIEDTVFEIFEAEEDARAAMASISESLWQEVEVNFSEWLLAEGEILVKGEMQRVSELLLGPRGPLLTVEQRAWLEQLARRPLRLYDVTEVVPDQSITLCDALDSEQTPVVVTERTGSRSMRVGMQIGVRVMEVAGQHQLSGVIYPFYAWAGRGLQERLRTMLAESRMKKDVEVPIVGPTIMDAWLEQHLTPAPLPQIIDSTTGEPMLFVTDHYEVLDWEAFAAALAARPDVDGSRDKGWDRLIEGEDGSTRCHATITPAPGGQRVSVFYTTARFAERGRAWFDALAGDLVRFLLQEVSDPKGVLSQADASAPPISQGSTLPADLDSETLAAAIESMLRRSYANWADEPLPALNGQTPREAIQSVAGLERVKGLLRSYEDKEPRQAAQHGRREISYQFLWDALGLTR